ncbi:MAG: aminodeoxychorismate synthase component I [Gammaproteobacteria bacterium]|nr:aminodeoxychorismate synthase component I [Gammaproteobacteria bacterium]
MNRIQPLDFAPDLLALHAKHPERYPYLLESAAPPHGRFDILFAFPGESLILHADGRLVAPVAGLSDNDFFDALDVWWRMEQCEPADEVTPFTGGWFVYLGYELAAQVEPRLTLRPSNVLPVAFATRIRAALVRDRATQRSWSVVEVGADDSAACMRADLTGCAAAAHPWSESLRTCSDAVGRVATGRASMRIEEEPAACFFEAVGRAQSYIEAGDVYQVNLSRAWSAETANLDAADVYRRLRATNPGPFAGLVRWRDVAIISSSPERLLRIRGNVAESRPIAGTRPRGALPDADRRLSEELIAHPKERAEHIMLIDLARNDLGRVCRPGSIEVNELMAVESYAHVHHIVSNVRGLLQDSATPGRAMRAMFPGGTITGCPKLRCMQIIDELEGVPRGAYTGSIGYLNRDGSCDLNILIRTLVQRGSRISLRTGAGIVADSDARHELEECRAKARGLLLALEPDPA